MNCNLATFENNNLSDTLNLVINNTLLSSFKNNTLAETKVLELSNNRLKDDVVQELISMNMTDIKSITLSTCYLRKITT